MHSRKILDTVGLQKVEERSKQFLIEKIIHGAEFESLYQLDNKPEIIDTIESNHRIARRVYQQLFIDISQLFAEFIKSLNYLEIDNMNNDIRANGWGIKNLPMFKTGKSS